MSNEAMRLPSGEVNSSVHYQKMFALSKTLNSHIPVLPDLVKRRRTPCALLMLSAHSQGGPHGLLEFTILVQVREC
jgi:hypothetical protein